jgi:uncharacterized GH25 family protein
VAQPRDGGLMKRVRLAIVAAAVVLAAAPLAAHDFWIEPSTFHPAPGQTVSLGLRVGQNFVGDAVRRSADLIVDFTVRQDGQTEAVAGSDGSDPAGFIRADGRGTAVVVYTSEPSFIEMPPAKFEDYLRQEGLEAIVATRQAKGKSGKAGLEYFSRCAKALLTGKQASAVATTPLGLDLEIVPEADPTVRFEPFRAHLLYDGRPLAGALVVAMPHDSPVAGRLTARTDAQGAFAFALPHGGVWLIKAVHMVEAGWFSKADWRSYWASLTFDAPDAVAAHGKGAS